MGDLRETRELGHGWSFSPGGILICLWGITAFMVYVVPFDGTSENTRQLSYDDVLSLGIIVVCMTLSAVLHAVWDWGPRILAVTTIPINITLCLAAVCMMFVLGIFGTEWSETVVFVSGFAAVACIAGAGVIVVLRLGYRDIKRGKTLKQVVGF